MADARNLLIIGSGAATHTAAIYAARASLQPLVVELKAPSGQAADVDKTADRPGFPQEMTQAELVSSMRAQAERFGASYVQGPSVEVALHERPFAITVGDTVHHAHALILADDSASLRADGAQKTPDGVFVCPSVAAAKAPVVVAAAEGCQACIEAERWLQSRDITDADQQTERW